MLAVYNWKAGTERGERVNRFVERLFNNVGRLQQPPFHPGWKDISLGAKVPGWQRYPYVDSMLERLKQKDAGLTPGDSPLQHQRFNTFLTA